MLANPSSSFTFQTKEEADAFRETIYAAGLRWCRPIYWHNRAKPFPKQVTGASCFFLKFRDRVIGVTAAHVIRQFEAAARETPLLVCQLHLMEFDLSAAIIDADDDLDIATFAISENDVKEAGADVFDVSIEWPPSDAVKVGANIQFIGYPENIRIINPADNSGLFQAIGGLDFVKHFSERDIFVVYEPDNVIGTPTNPPPGYNMSGSSGGAAVIHSTQGGLHRWWPVGLIVGGPLGQGEGDAESFDLIRIRRIDRIQPNGHIRRDNDTGWLPGR